MFVACGIWCLADVSSVSPSSEQTQHIHAYSCSFKKIIVISVFSFSNSLYCQ